LIEKKLRPRDPDTNLFGNVRSGSALHKCGSAILHETACNKNVFIYFPQKRANLVVVTVGF
jgi:hypothetical protein